MGLYIHRSERTDALLSGLADLLTEAPADPFTPDIVAVPTPGIERFITQGLGRVLGVSEGDSDGVCANVSFPSPSVIVNHAVARASGVEPTGDPWLPHRAVWPLVDVIDRSAAEPWCAPLAVHLGLAQGPDDERRNRRFAVASRLAGLFATYASQRPQILREWADGQDTDGAGSPVPADLAWQPMLWRALRDEIGTPSAAERLARADSILRQDPHVVDLPERLSVFGASRLPADQLQVLASLGAHREVHLWLADASPSMWAELPETTSRRREDTSATVASHPLLRSLGRDAHELRARLRRDWPDAADEHLPGGLTAGTLLGTLQCQIRDNENPRLSQPGPLTVTQDDTSIQVHACHGPARQAEVIREAVLRLLQSDPTLEPRDILIMCPDLDVMAPLLSAAFSTPSHSLRLRIADRTPEQANDVLNSLAALLELSTGRVELSTLLDFAGRPPVRRKFGFDDDGLERLEDLTALAGVRWGLDDNTRDRFSVRLRTGTWAWGLDRLLLGAAMSEDGLALLDGVLPVDDVSSGDVDLVGRFAELVTRLQQLRDAMSQPHPVAEWVSILGGALTDLMEVGGPDAWQLPNAAGAVAALADNAVGYAASVSLSLADIRWLLAEALRGRPTRSNFRSGDLTVCGLVPMRSVPHRVICLVGMDDAVFPRISALDGDDVLARDPLIGEREPHNEDRQILLDAIMAAQDHLVITYTGADERTNEQQPPCVPLGDLLDTLDAMAVTTTAAAVRDQVLVRHPLQPFDVRNFTGGALGGPEPFSHDRAALAAARRGAEPRTPRPSLLLDGLPAWPVTQVSPQQLGEFLTSPPKAFLKTRLGMSVRGEDDPPPEQIPVSLTGLTRWQVGDRILRLLTRGESVDDVAAAEWARGQVPPGQLGAEVLGKIGREASAVAQRFKGFATGQPRQVSINLTLPDGVRVIGTVPDVYNDTIVRSTFSRAKARDDVRLWTEVLALAAAQPDRQWFACMVSHNADMRLRAPAAPAALRILAELVDIYRAGMSSPLPLPADSSRSYTKCRNDGSDVRSAVYKTGYRSWQRNANDRMQPEIVALWGPDAPISVLLEQRPAVEENWFDEDTRFGMLARRIWTPILEAREEL